jgi:protein disulfide-isomerase
MAASAQNADSIQWNTNFDDALAQAQERQLPIFLLFEGSDWCGWCKKLNSEILQTPTFAKMMGNKMIFVSLDFPARTPLPPDQAAHNEQLKQKYGVSGFPTVVILDSQGRRLTNMGYIPGGPKNYAEQIQVVIDRS